MKITYSDLKKTFPEEKKSVESLYGIIIPVRKISYFVTIPFLKFGVSAFKVSVISIVIAIIACAFLCIPNSICRIIGVILVPIWHLFDCIDGNIARYNKTGSVFGEAVDAISGYYMYAFLPIALGIASFNISNNLLGIPSYYFLIMGGLASIEDLLMRLIHQKYVYAMCQYEVKTGIKQEKGDNQYKLKGWHKIRKMVDVELTPVGVPMFILWLSPIFNLFYILTIFYFILFSFSLFVMTIYYLRKCHNYDK